MDENFDKILSVDIGGTNIKTVLLNREGQLVSEYKKLRTPDPATPEAVLNVISQLAQGLNFQRISVGFPGYIKNGVVHTAPNLGTENWVNVNFEKLLTEKFNHPAKVINDADMQGFGVISGQGFEMVVTLGTGFGTAFFRDGILLPHLEISQHPIKKKATYDQYIGNAALQDKGQEKWNERLKYILDVLKKVFNYDTLYLGGGNAKEVTLALEEHIVIVTNQEGIDGGARLWNQNNI